MIKNQKICLDDVYLRIDKYNIGIPLVHRKFDLLKGLGGLSRVAKFLSK